MVKHLNKEEITKKGSFHTPEHLVDITYELIKKNKLDFDFICDTSAGYGDFIKKTNKNRFIYVDIDKQALEICQNKHGNLYKYLHLNSLFELDRKKLEIEKNKKLLIIGNPPYNNVTSFFKNGQKGKMLIREEIKSNDLGISFLRSYDKLKAEYVCVLHPLSYLIKKCNFGCLKDFKNNYSLIDGYVVSSKEFKLTSTTTQFPILIGMYKRDNKGMTYEEIKAFTFKVYNSPYQFNINQFMYVEDLHTKYKDKKVVGNYQHFYTLRDMNWLSINKTWLDKETSNSIRVQGVSKKLFNYIDQLKQWFSKYKNKYWFLGNLSPIIFQNLYKKNKINEEEFSAMFEEKLTVNNLMLQPQGDNLIWALTKISANGKYRFKDRKERFDHGQVLPSATNKVSAQSYLEVQIAYDKSINNFYEKPSLTKVSFLNNKKEKKFIFELSDIIYWGLLKKWTDQKSLRKILIKMASENFKILEDEFQITRDKSKQTNFFYDCNFDSLPIIKPSFISEYIENDFIEIKIDYKQKALGVQAMLYYNINAQNLTKNGEKIIGQTINQKDLIKYTINERKFKTIFLKLISVFSQLSSRHKKDILAIINQIINKFEEQENLCQIKTLNTIH